MIRSVTGVVAPDAVAHVSPHEHVLHRIAAAVPSTTSADSSATATGIRNEDLHAYRVSPGALGGQNLVLEKEDEAFRELELLQALGSDASATGQTNRWPLVVDVTVPIEGRDEFMTQRVRLAEKLKVHLVTVTTCDFEKTSKTFPRGLPSHDQAERIAKVLETELLFGLNAESSLLPTSSSRVCAGAIYQQLHTASSVLSENQTVTVHAIALVRLVTGYLCNLLSILINNGVVTALFPSIGAAAHTCASVSFVLLRHELQQRSKCNAGPSIHPHLAAGTTPPRSREQQDRDLSRGPVVH